MSTSPPTSLRREPMACPKFVKEVETPACEETDSGTTWKGKEKQRKTSAFDLLPREIIQQILYTADPNTFDSLTLINSQWHRASRSSRLYAHQLSRCGVTKIPVDKGDSETLPSLVRLFHEEGRRGLFETILQPKVTEIRLICSASSSAVAFPGGEAFRFEFSPRGTYLLALLSSRIFVLDLSKAVVKVGRELKISKRPVSATILDDGSILAVLSSNHHITLYDLTGPKAKILRSFPLDEEPRIIALSPGAEVLGVAYNGGIEVYSLHADADSTDRRAVKCDAVDSLAFSPDGSILLGTTLNSKSPTTVIVSAQHFSTDMPVEGLAQLWTTQVLFPRSSRDSSHAILLPGDEDEDGAAWTFTYDRVYDTFRAVRVDDLRNGHTYFAGPSDVSAGVTPPSTLPSPTRDGSFVAAGFGSGKVWVYGIPRKLDLSTESSGDSGSWGGTPERSNSNASRRDRSQLGSIVVPQWQVLCEKHRNVFTHGREIGQVSGLSSVKFVSCENGSERLIAVAGGGVDEFIGDCGNEGFAAIGGGRVIIYDFTRGPTVKSKQVVTIEIGDGIQGPVEVLEEEHRDIEVEVDIARRRTVAFNRDRHRAFPQDLRGGGGSGSGIDHSTMRRQSTMPIMPAEAAAASRSNLRVGGGNSNTNYQTPDDPYIQGAPRSRDTIERAANLYRVTPQLVDSNRYAHVVGPDGLPLPAGHQNRIVPGPRGEDEPWIPPPPPYSPRNSNPTPLPASLLWSLQGPPRHPEVHQLAPESPPPLQRAHQPPLPPRTAPLPLLSRTFDSVMRSGTVFRLNTLTTGTTSAASAPASPSSLTSNLNFLSPFRSHTNWTIAPPTFEPHSRSDSARHDPPVSHPNLHQPSSPLPVQSPIPTSYYSLPPQQQPSILTLRHTAQRTPSPQRRHLHSHSHSHLYPHPQTHPQTHPHSRSPSPHPQAVPGYPVRTPDHGVSAAQPQQALRNERTINSPFQPYPTPPSFPPSFPPPPLPRPFSLPPSSPSSNPSPSLPPSLPPLPISSSFTSPLSPTPCSTSTTNANTGRSSRVVNVNIMDYSTKKRKDKEKEKRDDDSAGGGSGSGGAVHHGGGGKGSSSGDGSGDSGDGDVSCVIM